MILEKQTENLVVQDGDIQESTDMVLDLESATFLMQMLSKFYSDAIGSLIRETASNALDSHRAAKVDDPIIVSFNKDTSGNHEFSVEDFGIGISADDVENIIKKYGKSTKRQIVDQLGAFGLGFKSPLAYTSSFRFVCRKDGIERKYMMYESENEANRIDLLYENPTTERNGVKIIVPVKYSDIREFREKIREQLAYFEGVYFNCEGIENDFKIIRGKDYQWSQLCNDHNLHICLDNVYYPLDFNKLGISSISFPVGLRFSLSDGIIPIPNRESIKYTKEAKEVILKKIQAVGNYFINKYNETIKNTDDPYAIMSYFGSYGRYIDHFDPEGHRLDTTAFQNYATIKYISPKLNGIKLLDMKRIYDVKDYMFYEYTRIYQCHAHTGRFKSLENNNWNKTVRFDNINQPTFLFSGTLTQTKKSYIKDVKMTGSGYYYFVKKNKTIRLGKLGYSSTGYDNYITILDLKSYPKSEWRERIKELQYIISLFVSKFEDLGEVVIPQDWLDNVKAKKAKKTAPLIPASGTRRVKLEGEVTGKMSYRLERYVDGKNCKFVPQVIQMNTAHRNPYVIIYGDSSYEDKFQQWYNLTHDKSVRFVIFSQRELKKLEDVNLHNWISMEEFQKGKNKIFKRVVTAFLIDKLINDNSHSFNKSDVISKISTSLYDKMKELKEYKHKYYVGTGSENLEKEMIELAEENNLFDTSIYDVYKEVKFILDKLYFIESICSQLGYYNVSEGIVQSLTDLFKYHKQRIDWKHYKLPLNEDETTPIIEEEIEQLI